jgi:hypothetical protein
MPKTTLYSDKTVLQIFLILLVFFYILIILSPSLRLLIYKRSKCVIV